MSPVGSAQGFPPTGPTRDLPTPRHHRCLVTVAEPACFSSISHVSVHRVWVTSQRSLGKG